MKQRRIGVYRIRNRYTGAVYVGKSRDIRKRYQTHKRQLQAGTHPNEFLQADWDQYGAGGFTFRTIAKLSGTEKLSQREVEWIDHFLADPKVPYIYNRRYKTPSLFTSPPSTKAHSPSSSTTSSLSVESGNQEGLGCGCWLLILLAIFALMTLVW